MKRLPGLIQSALKGLDTVAAFLAHPFLLAVRLYWGWQFFLTGKGKLLDLPKVTGFFTELGLPMPGFQAWLAGTTECVGGLLLLIGLWARPAAVPLIFTMGVAYYTADHEALTGAFSDPDTFLAAAPFLFLLASMVVFLFGPGWISADGLIKFIRCRKARTASSPATIA